MNSAKAEPSASEMYWSWLLALSSSQSLGAGEAACTPVGAALANAVYDAIGVRLRTVPFTPERMKAALGGRTITVGEAAYLDDGTLAGSVLTMDRAFAMLVTRMGLSFVDAATVCATTPARALGLRGFGVIAPGATGDLTVLSRDLGVAQTWIGGELAFSRTP